jgi:hypothetical protein
MLAAADEVTRQRCMRIIEAASTGTCSPLQGIAAAVALTRDLLGMKNLSAVTAVLAALGVTMGDASFKAVYAVYDVLSLIEGFGYDAAKASGCDMSSVLVSCTTFALQPPPTTITLELNYTPNPHPSPTSTRCYHY